MVLPVLRGDLLTVMLLASISQPDVALNLAHARFREAPLA